MDSFFRSGGGGGGGGGIWARRRVSRGGGMLPLLALHVANEFYRTGRRPPVTAGLILANSLVYLRPGPLDHLLPTLAQVSFNPHLILKYGDMKRLFLSAFYHLSDSHLFYNMASLVWKGIQLESSMGSLQFASMVAVLLGLSQGVTLVLSKGLLLFFDYESAYYHEFAVGFSGVLFGMKVVLNAQSEEYANIHGMIVPARYAVWAELILIQLFVPGVSFLGHLGGILAGLIYLRWRRLYLGPDPLTVFIREFARIVSWPLRFFRRLFRSDRPRIVGSGGRVGRSTSLRGMSEVWGCPTCTYNNSALSDVCEMCSTSRRGHHRLESVHRPSQIDEPSVEELRRRRLERFNR